MKHRYGGEEGTQEKDRCAVAQRWESMDPKEGWWALQVIFTHRRKV